MYACCCDWRREDAYTTWVTNHLYESWTLKSHTGTGAYSEPVEKETTHTQTSPTDTHIDACLWVHRRRRLPQVRILESLRYSYLLCHIRIKLAFENFSISHHCRGNGSIHRHSQKSAVQSFHIANLLPLSFENFSWSFMWAIMASSV